MSESLKKRFFKKVKKTNLCWNWIGSRNKYGYGTFWDNGSKLAHRMAWIIARGKIQKDFCVLHHCDNPRCVKIRHLFIGTNADNVADREFKNRGVVPRSRGEKNGQSKLMEFEIREIRNYYATGSFSQKELACKYSVSQPHIGDIVSGKLWGHLDD